MTLLMAIIVVYFVFLSGLILSQGHRKKSNRALFVVMVTVVPWLMSIFGLQTEYGQTLIYSRVVFALGACSILALVWFVATLAPLSTKQLRGVRITVWLLTVLLSMLCASSFVIADIARGHGVLGLLLPQYGPLIIVYVACLLAAIGATVYLIILGSRRGSSRVRSQMRTVGISMLASMAVGFMTNFLIPLLFQDTQSALFLPVAALILVSGLTYAIVHKRLFDLQLVAVRTTVYILSLGTLAAIYFATAYVASVLFFRQESPPSGVSVSPLNIIFALGLAFLFQPVKHFFDQFTNRIFYRGVYDQDMFMREFGRILSHDTDLSLLLKRVGAHIGKTFSAEEVFFYIRDKGILGRYNTKKLRMSGEDIATIDTWFSSRGGMDEMVLLRNDAEDDIQRLLHSHKTQIVVQLRISRQTSGYLFVGEHKGRGYSLRDVRTLGMVDNELAIAIQNALSVEEVRDLNRTLEQRVDNATKELRESNRQLQRLDEAKTEFISMASHQLRTPLTSIKGYLDMMLQGDLGKISATQRTVLLEAFLSSERMVTLINDFLNVSRLQTGKFVIDRAEGDVKEVVKDQVAMLQVIAKQHSLKIKERIDAKVPLMNVDIDKVRQVVLNFIDNAIYYSRPNTTIHVSLAREKNHVVFMVQDSGIGVPEEEKAKLFGRFFRAHNARKRRPDGTGVGLFLAKKIILLHGGEIIFESEEGKGSTFGFRLPIASSR